MEFISQTKIPNISNYSQYIHVVSLNSDVTIVLIFKQLFRSNNIIVDIYLNEISENTKIRTGVNLCANSLICRKNYDIGFEYDIYCVDSSDIGVSLNKNNAHRFDLLFVGE